MKTCFATLAVVLAAVVCSAGENGSSQDFVPPVEAVKPKTGSMIILHRDGRVERVHGGVSTFLVADEARRIQENVARRRRISAIEQNVFQAVDKIEHRLRVKEADRRLQNAVSGVQLAPVVPVRSPYVPRHLP